MAERRKLGRSRVLKSAKLVLGRSAIIDCIVRNVTNSGARLQIANTVDLPEEFEMTFDGGYSIRPCRLSRSSSRSRPEVLRCSRSTDAARPTF